MWYEESDLNCGLWEACSSITILHLLTQHCQLDSSWQNIQFVPFRTPPIHLISPLLNFLFPKLKITHEVIFQTVEDVNNVINDLKVIPQTSI
jgi:hypothetical protein